MDVQSNVIATVIVNTLVIYLFLVLGVRLLGRRQLAQLTSLDLLILILLGSSVETSMVAGSTTMLVGFVAATVLLGINRLLIVLLGKSKKLNRLCGSGPILLVHNGAFIEEHLKRTGLTQDDVLEAIRGREHADLADIRFAVLEADGEVNIITKEMQVSVSSFPSLS